ncbi:hypothetical protein ACC679_11235 [Rhizobium ruizarguesonis]
MKSMIIISDTRPNFGQLSEVYDNVGSTNMQSSKRLVVEGNWGWFAIEIDDSLEGEFSDDERAKIAEVMSEPVYAQLEYSNIYAADLAIKLMPTTAKTLVDNDNGMIRPIEEVRELFRSGREWQT